MSPLTGGGLIRRGHSRSSAEGVIGQGRGVIQAISRTRRIRPGQHPAQGVVENLRFQRGVARCVLILLRNDGVRIGVAVRDVSAGRQSIMLLYVRGCNIPRRFSGSKWFQCRPVPRLSGRVGANAFLSSSEEAV